MMKQIKAVIERFVSLDGTLFRYSLSYGVLLAIFPGLFVLVMLYESSILNLNDLLRLLYLFLPAELIAPFVEFLLTQTERSLFSGLVSLAVAVWVSGQSFYSFLLISASHEQVAIANFFLRIKAVLLFLFFVLSLMLITVAALIIPLEPLVFLYLALTAVLTLFYRTLTFYHRPIDYGLFGAMLSAAAIMLTGAFFFWAIQTFTSYDSVYGPLASVVILFVSVYVLSSLLYFGYCVNLTIQPIQPGMKKKNQKWTRRIERFQKRWKKEENGQ